MGELSHQDARLRLTVSRDEADQVSGELWSLGTLGIEEQTNGEEVVLLAGFDSAVSADDAAKQLRRFAIVEEFGSRDYLDTWREFATIYRTGNRLVVKAPWVSYEPAATELVLWIDPGRSFGSGSHPSTQLALAELERLLEGNESVLDVGCGSGVLSVAAARLGATRVVGIDIDPASPQLTLDNAKANGVEEFIEASTTAVSEIDDTYDVVVANMLASTLREQGPNLVRRVRPTGRLIVSGILTSQIQSVSGALRPLDLLTTQECDIEEGSWVSLTFG
ncbi:MAG: 50S ribosomal protein L11 methyltransferase [Actinomycetota bacterium]|nr:50S ribosomal protein L11 methyltransferase [Actinomycetota bacterium]MEC9058759.1 50S ribosomal protein L11 methyltransferase [Actinomycetota bacterium]MED5362348.1 50S ribosomal protein L11 methyltransferase [Actinomycetota bacterium]|tara:strand:- start:463 stop:1296 length:834 start_codon:yes stop_codon:yes gene_type:complete